MADTQTLDQDVIDETQPITFSPREWFYFKEELVKQFVDEDLDTSKAIRRARYLNKLEQSFKQLEEGKVVSFTEAEWEAFANGQNLH